MTKKEEQMKNLKETLNELYEIIDDRVDDQDGSEFSSIELIDQAVELYKNYISKGAE